MEKEMEQIFNELTEENKTILIMVANGIKLGQENPIKLEKVEG